MSNQDKAQQGQQVEDPKSGDILTPEQIEKMNSEGKMIAIGLDQVQVAQLIAFALVEQGQLTADAMLNTVGSVLTLRDGQVILGLQGREPYAPGSRKPSN